MGRPRKLENASTTQRVRRRKRAPSDALPVLEKSSPAPARGSKGLRNISQGGDHTEKPFTVEEREGQGLCVLIDGAWQPAIWHHELLSILGKETYSQHFYAIEPPRRNDGQRPEDVTLFLPQQQSWGFESKEHRPDILFQLLPKVDQYPEENEPVPWLAYEIDGTAKVVVDVVSGHPLRDFKNIPIQLATNVEGGRMEAMCREDSRITIQDFLHRMIPSLDDNGQPRRNRTGTVISDRPKTSALLNVKTQFRHKCRCLSWLTSQYSSEFDLRLLRDISKEDQRDNTTRNLPDLSDEEVTALRSRAKGRKSRTIEPNKGSDSEAATEDLSDLKLTDNTSKQSADQGQDGGGTPKAATKCGIQAACDGVKYEIVAEPGTPTKRRRLRPQSGKKTVIVVDKDYQTPAGKTSPKGNELIDPALTRPPTPASSGSRISTKSILTTGSQPVDYPARSGAPSPSPPGGLQGILTAPGISDLPCGINPEPLSPEDAGTRAEVANTVRPLLKRKLANEGEDLDGDPVQSIKNSQRKAEPAKSPPKRQKIQPPTNDYAQLLKDFAATQRSSASTSNLGCARKQNPVSTSTSELPRHRSHSPQLYYPRQETPPLPPLAPLNRPRPSYSPSPPTTTPKTESSEVLEAERARFASVSAQLSSLDLLKTNLMQAWQEAQPDTTTGASLYGPTLNISLSIFGSFTSARTDTEMRHLMTSTFNIPPTWSASSIDLRQHHALRQAVHEAMCEAERFDVRNYHKDFPRFLTVDTEGGFFLATASPFSNKPGDGRFAVFDSAESMNKCLSEAVQRYKQLTGRDFGPLTDTTTTGEVGVGEMGTSYHDIWCEIRRQIFLPYFLRFKDPVEALAWMPELGFLDRWEGSAAKRQQGRKSHGRKWDGAGVANEVDKGGKICLPLASVDLEVSVGIARE